MFYKQKKAFILFNFIMTLTVFSQDIGKTIPLKEILVSIEKQHQVTFNFIEDEIAVFKIIPPQKEITFEEKITYLQSQTKLQFKIVSNNLVVISNNQKLDKPLCGYLIDKESKIPISNATLRISGSNTFTTSDENGYFELPVQSSNTIEINHISYNKLTVTASELYREDCPKIELIPFIQELDEVIAQKYLTSGIQKQQDGTFEIHPKKFGILPGLIEPDVFQTMLQIPGIISTDESVSSINVRGGTHDQNLFLWNGIRLFQTGHFFGLISALNPNLTHKISLSKNGSSAFYGESVSSVVDISSRSEYIENTHTTIGTNLINAEFYTKLKTSETSSVEIAARRSFTDVFESPTYKNYYQRIFQNTEVINLTSNQDVNYTSEEDFYFYDVTLQYQQKIGKKSVFYLDVIGISNELKFRENTLSNSQPVEKESDLSQQNLGGNFTWKTNWKETNATEVSVYSSYYNLESTNLSVTTNQILEQENNVIDNGIRLKNTHTISETIQLKEGYQFNEMGVRSIDKVNTPQYSRNVKDVLRSHIGIIEMDYSSKNKKLFSTIGARGNYFEKWQLILIEPRLLINYKFNPNFKIELLGEQKSQTSSQIIDLQQDFLGIENRRWVLANNEDIPIQKSNQGSLGFIFTKNNWLLNLEGFYKKVTGITSAAQGFQNQLEFVKVIGDYEVVGTEFLIQKQFNGFTGYFNYSWNSNTYTFEGYIPPQFANNFEVTHAMALAGTYEWKSLKLALGSKWFSGRPNTVPLSSEPVYITPDNPEIVYNLPNSVNLEDFFQVNFSASYALNLSKQSKLSFGVSILNLFNQKNSLNRFYRINTENSSIEEVNTYSLERTPNAFVKFSF